MFSWLTGTSDRRPWLLGLRSSKTLIIVTVSTAVFTDIFVYALIVPVFPFVLTERVGVEPDRVQTWISILLAVYGAALLVTSPFCGWYADRTTARRTPLVLGLIVLAASTVMLIVGNSLALLVAGRIIQGASSAVVWVTGLALLVDTVGSKDVGQAMGYVGISMSLAVLLAPLLGGVVFAKAGYYAVFAMAFGLIGVDIFLRLFMIERKFIDKWTNEGGAGPAEAKEADAHGSEVQETVSLDKTLPTAIALPSPVHCDPSQDIEAQTVEETKQESETATEQDTGLKTPRPPRWFDKAPPIIRLCTSQRVICALVATLVNSTLMTSFDATLPLFVHHTFDWDSIGAGLIFLPLVLATFTGPLVGHISDKYGPRWLATAGFILGGPFLILLRFVDHNTIQQKVLLCALLALVGITLTLVLTPVLAELSYIVAGKERNAPAGYYGKNGAYAQAYSLFNMSWACGTFLGPLLAGLVNEASGWAVAYLILGCLSLATAIPVAIYTGGNIFKLRQRKRTTAATANA